MQFDQLGLSEPLLRSLAAEGYTVPTPIQAKAIPHALAGKDVLGAAQTGTGKTAAFALPILHRLSGAPVVTAGTRQHRRPIRTLVLAPTRELALQIDESFRTYGRHTQLRSTVIFGGVGQNPQTRALHHGVDIVVATPGRLLDLMNQGFVDLRSLEVFVLDEADRMLDMGFINDIRKIVAKLPAQRQTLFFSATMPTEIKKLADALLRDPVRVEVAPVSSTAERVEQSVVHVPRSHKPAMLTHFIENNRISRVLVFTRTKHGADRVERHLERCGIRAEAIHGNKRQNARVKTMDNFRSGRTAVLIATDIAARGIDVDDISHVVNYDLPNEPETYVHRIGRTARAGASGIAVSFCDHEERAFLRDIERLIRKPIPVNTAAPDYRTLPHAPAHTPDSRDERRDSRQQGHPRHRERPHGAPRSGGRENRDPSLQRPHAPRHRTDGSPTPRPAHPKPAHPAPHSGKPAAHAPKPSNPPRPSAPRAVNAFNRKRTRSAPR